jgi:hypothetical protein
MGRNPKPKKVIEMCCSPATTGPRHVAFGCFATRRLGLKNFIVVS